MTLQEAYQYVGKGWHPLIKHYFGMMMWIGDCQGPESTWVRPEVVEVGHNIGMLKIKAECEVPLVQEMCDRLSWSIERDSARICEVCGKKGWRRKALPGAPNRCRDHYIELANEMADKGII